MDSLISEEDLANLRAASFMDTTLFAGAVTDVLPKLELARKESLSQQSIDTLASLAKKGVESSKPKASSSNSGQTFQKKLKKKASKKYVQRLLPTRVHQVLSHIHF